MMWKEPPAPVPEDVSKTGKSTLTSPPARMVAFQPSRIVEHPLGGLLPGSEAMPSVPTVVVAIQGELSVSHPHPPGICVPEGPVQVVPGL